MADRYADYDSFAWFYNATGGISSPAASWRRSSNWSSRTYPPRPASSTSAAAPGNWRRSSPTRGSG